MRKILGCLIFLGAFVAAQADMGEVFGCKDSRECSVRVNCPNCARVLSVSLFDKNGQEHPVDDFQMNYDSGKIHIGGMNLSHYDYLVCTFLNGNGKETSQRIPLWGEYAKRAASSKISHSK